MLETVYIGGSKTDVFGERVPDGRSGDGERSLTEPRPCPWCGSVSDIGEAASRWTAANWCPNLVDIRRTLIRVSHEHQQSDRELDGKGMQCH